MKSGCHIPFEIKSSSFCFLGVCRNVDHERCKRGSCLGYQLKQRHFFPLGGFCRREEAICNLAALEVSNTVNGVTMNG